VWGFVAWLLFTSANRTTQEETLGVEMLHHFLGNALDDSTCCLSIDEKLKNYASTERKLAILVKNIILNQD
jgi:hypothetical protein